MSVQFGGSNMAPNCNERVAATQHTFIAAANLHTKYLAQQIPVMY